ncbi:uncharacterized protein LOC111377505 [Olea europaea var. sylvestris]|uniref:uncharacterized protein LOC111377505 n=1 Tax=Olea europaea var. sylvestris TaxID=158386 RepID=UPI000C1D4403|nr:uncharacterized protein LOC111377505 [Olea europaea var. sylvestris]
MVVKLNTVRVLSLLAVNLDWTLQQLDIKNAFLNEELEEEVFMTIPSGFNKKNKENQVCKLKKSLYGLKESPRACTLGCKPSNTPIETGNISKDTRNSLEIVRHKRLVSKLTNSHTLNLTLLSRIKNGSRDIQECRLGLEKQEIECSGQQMLKLNLERLHKGYVKDNG